MSGAERNLIADLLRGIPAHCGQARNVEVDPAFGRWALEVSFRRLRPRYIVGVGLGGFLRESSRRWLLDAFGSYVGRSFHPDRAPISVPFRGYELKNYMFRVWPSSTADLGAQHLILFPQHPSRAPMTNASIWGLRCANSLTWCERCEIALLPNSWWQPTEIATWRSEHSSGLVVARCSAADALIRPHTRPTTDINLQRK